MYNESGPDETLSSGKNGDTHVGNHMGEGGTGTNGRNQREHATYATTIWVRASGKLFKNIRNSDWCSVMTLEGMGREGGWPVKEVDVCVLRVICIARQKKPTQLVCANFLHK